MGERRRGRWSAHDSCFQPAYERRRLSRLGVWLGVEPSVEGVGAGRASALAFGV